MQTGWRACLALCLVLGLPAAATAQPGATGTPSTRGTTLNAFGGVAWGSGDAGAVAGGAAGWEITPRVGLEGVGAWLDRPGGAEAFTATLDLHVNLTSRRTAVPFLKGGFGLYHASFDSIDDLPSFYRRRLTPTELRRGSNSFTDPALVAGGGLNVFLSRHVALRPEVRATFVRGDSRTYTVTSATMHLAYHFEEHPVTPSRN